MAYVLGFFAADGYITLNRRGANFWCIQIKDKTLLYQIRKVVKSNHKISERVHKVNKHILYRLQVGSKEMCDDLRNLGYFENKTKCLVVPHIAEMYFRHFIRGYFDGDGNVWMGYVHKERPNHLLTLRCVFTSCSEKFLVDIRNRLENCGVVGGVIRKGKGEYFRLSYSAKGALTFYYFVYNSRIKDFSGLCLERKKKVFERFIKCSCSSIG